MKRNEAQRQAVSEDIKSKLLSGDNNMIKEAALAATTIYRTEVRENGIRRQITPPTQVTEENFTPQENTDFPVMLVNIAPQSSGAYSVSFEAGPKGGILHTKRARVEFSRLMTNKYKIDKIRLATTDMPFLDMMHDLMLKDLMDREDEITINVDKAICGTLDTTGGGVIGKKRYMTVGPTTKRQSWVKVKKGILTAPGSLKNSKWLLNDITYTDFGGMTKDEMGGDLAQDILMNGVSFQKIQGVDAIITSKRTLIPDGDVFMYADQQYYGGFYVYQDVSMVTEEVDNIWLTFFAHETIGASVVNAAGVCRAKFGASENNEWE